MCSPDRETLYTGVTSELEDRVHKHREKSYPHSFSARYNCTVLVYFCFFDSIEEAIAEEKHIKAGSRERKIALINSRNKDWKDLWNELDKYNW